ncbi:phosphoribosyltransferase family protein [Flavobacterium sp.]|uniref:phosphoribosyltransferase family protein n=1 Tax=Flavobacterium sp. TaxID=239 RepID=UPI0026119F7A|nr:phosphoribosyltransferase family protein [Flavobacterium sp.]
MSQHIILNHNEISHKITRMAYQIYETFIDEDRVVIAGIQGNGHRLAQLLAEEVRRVSPLQTILCEVQLDKSNPRGNISSTPVREQLADTGLVLVDDVLHSGTTLIYAVRYFLDIPLRKFKTAVLVDRNHKMFPVKADFKGISLSTSLQEHVEVVLDGPERIAYLR